MKKCLICLCLFLTACINPTFRRIEGKSQEDVREIKGDPVTIFKEKDHEMWTYRQEGCTQIVFFDTEKRASDFHEFGACQAEVAP